MAAIQEEQIQMDITPTWTGVHTFNEKIELVSGQLVFPASQSASADAHTLDDYEEGSWTPVLSRATTPSAHTYVTQAGRYTKIGNLVTATFLIRISATGTAGTGPNIVTGLPFSCAYLYQGVVSFGYNDILSVTAARAGNISTSTIYLVSSGPTQSNINEAYKDGSAFLTGTMTYITAD